MGKKNKNKVFKVISYSYEYINTAYTINCRIKVLKVNMKNKFSNNIFILYNFFSVLLLPFKID